MDADQSAPRLSGVAVFFYVFLPFALGHYLSSLLRNVNAVLAPQLVGALALTPGQLGLLTSAFFFAFALVQLPVGIALDRYGPRKVQLYLMLMAACGALLFAYGQSFTQLVVARAIIGFGLGGCFMSAVKAISTWISPKKLPSVQGYLIAVGGLGAASSTMPVRALLQHTDWRGLFILLAVLSACSGLLIWLVSPRSKPLGGKTPTVRSVLDVYRTPAFRTTISLVLLPHAVFFGIQGLWIGRWLSDVARFPESAVAYLLYMGMASVIFGAIAVGMITEWAGRRGIRALDVAAVGVALFVIVQSLLVIGYKPSLQTLSVLFTLVGTITGIEYAIVAQSLPRELTGRAATCLNLLIFIGAFLVQAGFGQVVGLWRPDLAGHYPAQAYRVAFGVLVLLQVPGLIRYYLDFLRRRRPVKCGIALLAQKEEYEIGTLRSPR
ncbi:putative sulfoacetate transporter SauU [Massilia sp. Bi118]|uniref:MFS transporter n=1 Tax=Massilia sp. Bi118 TaxID=2822346 RepID=UPI001DA7CE29|nr:MFS transporter [Massilia sp. Bi118]CAH0244794.1 putative sulfoacetate transporter SauU [Massilia sp. Bi118]